MVFIVLLVKVCSFKHDEYCKHVVTICVYAVCLGSRLIILHAGSENGWVPSCALVFKSGKSTGTLHEGNLIFI